MNNTEKEIITICFKIAKISVKGILNILKRNYNISKNPTDFKLDTSNKKKKEISIDELINKDKLSNISISSNAELRELKKELNKHGVYFSVKKNLKDDQFEVFFQAKDIEVLNLAFKNSIHKFEQKEKFKEKTKEKINKFKENLKEKINFKTKNKHKER